MVRGRVRGIGAGRMSEVELRTSNFVFGLLVILDRYACRLPQAEIWMKEVNLFNEYCVGSRVRCPDQVRHLTLIVLSID